MHPPTPFCHNPHGRASGQVGPGNIRVPSQTEPHYRWTSGRQTVAATQGTPLYRLRTAAELGTVVLPLRSHGCPIQALVAAFGVEERPVAAGRMRAGQHGQQVHRPVVQPGQVALPHVQADELWVKLVGGRVGLAMALAVPARRGLGGVLSPRRDLLLSTPLVQLIRTGGGSLAILGGVDGLASSVTAVLRVFRHPVRTGRRGRPRLVLEAG
jgi:hypothetical protein